ncbi:K(+)-transporting ATPase subunit C [Thermoleophilia bacterium SCSIO 60948]|nr:K(+)-transporting ATPase subunit C [Thermoleophilia bacterium SCSIO 60948]
MGASKLRDAALTSLRAIVVLTVVCGIAYPLLVTGLAQVAFPGAADGTIATRDGGEVGSELIGQDFRDEPGYFQSRPSITGYAADATYFNNQGPNQAKLARQQERFAAAYVRREAPFNPGLEIADVPADAATTSASGVDPQISPENASIQAPRVADARGLGIADVERLIEDNTSGRALGFIGSPGVDLVALNLALDAETGVPDDTPGGQDDD